MACTERAGARFVSWALLLAAAAVPAAAEPTTTLVYPPWKHCYGMHRVTQTHLTMRAGFRARFDDPQGVAAVKLRAEDDTTTTRDDDELTVFGVNSGQNMLIYNTTLTSIAFYGHEGDGIGEFRHPLGIAADRDGHVVVADTGNDRLHLLQYAGDALHHERFLQGEFGDKRLARPTGVALEGGEIYACDPENNRILVLAPDGTLRREIAPEHDGMPLLRAPFAVAVIRARSDFNFFGADFLAVVDSSQARLLQLGPNGTLLATRRCSELGRAGQRFDYVAIDDHANVYVSDRSGRLHKFDRKLQTLLSIGKPGTGDYEFDEPRGLGLYRRFGQLFVAERAGAQYLWTGTDVFTPALVELQAEAGGSWKGVVRYFLTEYARVQLELVDAADQPVVLLQRLRWQAPGTVTTPVRFEVPPGQKSLRLRVEAVPTYSSRTYLVVRKHSAPLAVSNRTEAP